MKFLHQLVRWIFYAPMSHHHDAACIDDVIRLKNYCSFHGISLSFYDNEAHEAHQDVRDLITPACSCGVRVMCPPQIAFHDPYAGIGYKVDPALAFKVASAYAGMLRGIPLSQIHVIQLDHESATRARALILHFRSSAQSSIARLDSLAQEIKHTSCITLDRTSPIESRIGKGALNSDHASRYLLLNASDLKERAFE